MTRFSLSEGGERGPRAPHGYEVPPEIAKIAIQIRSAIGQSNVQTMHAGGLTRLQNPPARQFCRPRDLYPNVPHTLCDDLHWILRPVGQPQVTATGQRALDRTRSHRRIMRGAKPRHALVSSPATKFLLRLVRLAILRHVHRWHHMSTEDVS